MSADVDRGVLDSARGRFPQSRETSSGFGSFTRTRMERIIEVVVGLGCLALGAQAFVAAFGPSEEAPGWHVALVVVNVAPLAAMIAACFTGRLVRLFAGAFALLYAVTLLLWPIATAGSEPEATEQPWIWYLINVATVAAVLAYPLALQIAWTVFVPLLYGAVRLVQGGFARDFWIAVGLDVSFALILGGVLLALGWLFRSVAGKVDDTRARAIDSYARAAAADASEAERVAVAALMHDSVLAALIAVERADSPRARTLAVSMAREALTRLANAEQDSEEGSDAPVSPQSLAGEVERAARDLGVALQVQRDIHPDTPAVPGRVARALVLAVTQAVANAVEHADGAGLRVDMAARADPAGVRLRVRDSGRGFDVDRLPDDRLGIRASIFARVAAVGGAADIRSSRAGTTVTLAWDHDR